MADTLRSRLIRLAHAKPELRPVLLPLVKKARGGGLEEARDALQRAKSEIFASLEAMATAGDKVVRSFPESMGDEFKREPKYRGYQEILAMLDKALVQVVGAIRMQSRY